MFMEWSWGCALYVEDQMTVRLCPVCFVRSVVEIVVSMLVVGACVRYLERGMNPTRCLGMGQTHGHQSSLLSAHILGEAGM